MELALKSLIEQLLTSPQALTVEEAHERLRSFGRNVLISREKDTPFLLFLRQFKSPLVLILVFVAIISMITESWTDATIILTIQVVSTFLGFIQEYRASNAMEKLRSQVTHITNVLRDGIPQILPVEEVVPGDIVLLSAGSIIPANLEVLQRRMELDVAVERIATPDGSLERTISVQPFGVTLLEIRPVGR